MTTYNEILTQADTLGVAPSHMDMDAVGYEALQLVFQMAYDQASTGKGRERHADGKPFHKQPMQTESDAIDKVEGLIWQARKKSREALGMEEDRRKISEWLGAINYLAGSIIWTLRNPSEASDEALTSEGLAMLGQAMIKSQQA